MSNLLSRPIFLAAMLFLFVFLTLLLTPLLTYIDNQMGAVIDSLRPIIAILWVTMLAFWLSVLLYSQWYVLKGYVVRRKNKRNAVKMLSLLSDAQKDILKRLYGQGKIHSCALASDNPQVSILEHERILLRIDQFGSNGLPYYRIAPWVLLHLQENPSYLD